MQLGSVRHGLDLGVHRRPVAELQEAMEAGVVGEELQLAVARLRRHVKHFLRVREALVHELGRGERPVAGVQARDQHLLVVEPARQLDRLLAHGHAALHRLLATRTHLEGEVCQQSRAQRAVALGQRGKCLFQEPDARCTGLETCEEQEAPERGHIAQGRTGEQLPCSEAPRDLGRRFEARAGGRRVTRAPLCVSEPQEELAAALGGASPPRRGAAATPARSARIASS